MSITRRSSKSYSRHKQFERTMEQVAQAIARDDKRFGIQPRPRKDKRRNAD
jgi:hypothetical protein